MKTILLKKEVNNMEYASICIFTPTGRTYTFRDIKMLTDNESVLVFSYAAMSDGKQKVATFYKSNICGHSLTEK